MKSLKRIRYHTMNSWNNSTAPAYNLKVHNVADNDLIDKIFELMETENFWDNINMLINDFDLEHDYQWQAGFNGRSGGYLVLYKGGISKEGKRISYPGKNISDNEVPGDVLRSFRKLAIDIVKSAEWMAKNYQVQDEEFTVVKTRKIAVNILDGK